METLAAPAGGGPAGIATILPAARLRGEIVVPGDKSISHRALMLALLAEGESRIEGAGDGADVRSTAGICRVLGATIERATRDGRTVAYRVMSPGRAGIREPAGALDCGNSGTSLRLFAGILAGVPVTAVLDGDASLRRRPVARIIEPLRAMGATLRARDDDSLPPVTVTGRRTLEAIDWTTPVPSAQVKSSILLAGLCAGGITRVREHVATRDHTERMLRGRGVPVRSLPDGEGGAVIEIEGGTGVAAIDERVPGDPSAAAFWLVAGAIHPDAQLVIRNVGVNPTRRAIIDLLARMGARIEERPVVGGGGSSTASGDAGEPVADLVVATSELHAIEVTPADVAGAIDEIPILCLAATQARGRTTIRGAGELRHKESDRLAGIAAGLTALGARIALDGDDLMIDGAARLTGAPTDSLDDHRLAMTFAIAGLIAAGRTTVGRPSSASISYPGFFTELERIRP
ncbi:MAG TPA: 3-phosphoshikimate 1-carboxyvinyltransferase [Candidatus Sulfomarinibacteraceae bacterium]|nr:3-phosphoshikimate 1-carboxyvinyltransferase [Candidatus Sulfomarinibacteraceae bacterium]